MRLIGGGERMAFGGQALDLFHLKAQAGQRIFDRPRHAPRSQASAGSATPRHSLQRFGGPHVGVALRIEAIQKNTVGLQLQFFE